MKKKILVIICMIFMMLIFNSTDIKALNGLSQYYDIILSINEEYNAELYIMNKNEFLNSPIKDQFNSNYDLYINNILNTDIDKFRNECMDIVESEIEIEVSAISNSRSTLATKTVAFYSARNSMTLKYKYSGSKFDTSYKPTATVKKLNNTNYFSMTSYSGTFKNSNSTYSVVAKGKIYTITGVATNRSFTVNFNL